MNLLSFNKTNPNLTLNPFKEHKSTSSETQKNKLKNTNPFKHKHNINNTIAQIQAQIQKIQNQNSNPNQDIDTNITRISTSFKIFSISSIFLLTRHKITKRKNQIYRQISVLEMKGEKRKKKQLQRNKEKKIVVLE